MTIPARARLSWRTAWLAMLFATVLLLPPIARAQTTISVTASFSPLAYYFDGGSPNPAITLSLGAFVGDNTSYALGRYLGRPVQQRVFAGERAQRRLEWAQRFLKERGSYVLIVARFVPGGRTATTFC